MTDKAINELVSTVVDSFNITKVQKVFSEEGIQWPCGKDYDGEVIMCVPTVEIIKEYLTNKATELLSSSFTTFYENSFRFTHTCVVVDEKKGEYKDALTIEYVLEQANYAI